ncbi:MAG: hypothetical protein WAT81_00035 [Candidatus Moraniibacteriota bacterium]
MNEVQHFIGLNKTPSGKYFGLSNESGTQLVDPATVDKACFNSFETGWEFDGKTSRACAPVDPTTGYAELPINTTCNKAVGTWSVILKDKTVLWSDNKGDRMWETEGLPAIRHPDPTDPLYGLLEYGVGGRKQPTASAMVVGSKVDLTINFGSNCLGGFGYEDSAGKGHLTNLMPAPNTYYKFLYNSNEKGWGLVQVGETKPSTTEAYAEYDLVTGSYSTTFKGLTCGDRAQIIVYKGVGPTPDKVVWEHKPNKTGTMAEGAGWFAIQKNPTELQLWVAQTPLTFDRDEYQFVLPPC